MERSLAKLLSISSEAIVGPDPDISFLQNWLRSWGRIGSELAEVLIGRNGFWAYESSLLFRPFRNGTAPLGLIEWNEKVLWKGEYAFELGEVLFFAEDAFGCQYCIENEKIKLFDPETAQFEKLAESLDEWAQIIIQDYEYRTGYPLAHDWQIQNKPLAPGTRLHPNVPFVLGGKYELENLHIGADIEGMIFRANIANQIKDIPDGWQIILEIINKKES